MNLFGVGRRLLPARLFHTDAHGCDLERDGCVIASSAPAAPTAPAPIRSPVGAPQQPQVRRQDALTDVEALGLVRALLEQERAPAARSPFAGLPPSMGAAVATAIARTPAPRPAPATSTSSPSARTDVDHLLGLTPFGQEALQLRRQRERDAAARTPAPISATVRHALSTTHLGREILAERARRDPEGEAAAAGVDPARRRELLEASTLGRSQLREEARRAG